MAAKVEALNSQKLTAIKTTSGLQYVITKKGTGENIQLGKMHPGEVMEVNEAYFLNKLCLLP
jgi:hypothetical protein